MCVYMCTSVYAVSAIINLPWRIITLRQTNNELTALVYGTVHTCQNVDVDVFATTYKITELFIVPT